MNSGKPSLLAEIFADVKQIGAPGQCPTCGAENVHVDIGIDGLDVWASPCDCERKYGLLEEEKFRLRSALQESEIPVKYLDMNFSDFVLDDGNRDFFTGVEKWVERYPDTPSNGLLLAGSVGTGKTAAAAIAGRVVAERGDSVFFTTAASFAGRLERYRFQPEYGPFIDKLRRVPVLIFDDLAETQFNDTERKIFADIIDSRYGAELTTIFTTMFDPAELVRRLGDHLVSRIVEMVGGERGVFHNASERDHRRG